MKLAGPRADARLGLALAAVVVAWALPGVFVGGVLYIRDVHIVWYPQVEGFVRAIHSGAWPLWDPTPGFGQPLLADPSAMIAYPPTWLNLVMPGWLYYSVFAVAHLAFSVLGAYLLARRWKYTRAAAATSAALWGFSGPLLSLVSLWHHYASATWMPWVFLAAERALLRRRWRDCAVWALVVAAQILAGSADMCAMTLMGVAGYAATRWIRWRAPWSTRNRRLLAAAASALGLALALSAVLWMPTLEVARHSARFGLSEQTRTFWSVHPLGLLQAWIPNLWYGLALKDSIWALMWESREPFLSSLYVGAASVALVAAAAAGRRPRRRFLIGLALTSILIALGRFAPFYTVAVTVFPLLRILRYPMKCCLPAAFAWALLAGMGVDAIRRARGGRPARAALAASAVLAACTGAVLFVLLVHPLTLARPFVDFQSDAARAVKPLVANVAGALVASFLATVVAAAALRQPARAARWAALAGLLAVLDAGWFNQGANETGNRFIYARPPVVDVLRREKAGRVYVYDYAFGNGERHLGGKMPALTAIPPGWTWPAAVALAEEMQLMPPSAGRWGIDTAYEHDLRGLFPWAESQLVLLVQKVDGTPLVPRLLRMGATTHMVTLHGEDLDGLRLVTSIPGLFVPPVRVFEVPDPLPRAYAVSGVRPASGVGAFKEVLDPEFDPAREVILPADTPRAPAAEPAGTVRIVSRRSDRIVLSASLQRAGWVVAVEGFDESWRAWVDGRPADVLPANLAFRAVRVEAGEHTVEMRYRPRGALAGAIVTLFACALAGLAAWPRRPDAGRAGAR